MFMAPVLQCTQCTSFNDSTHGIGFAERVALCRRQASDVLRCASPLRSNTSGSPLVRAVRAVALAHCIYSAQTASNSDMQREYNTKPAVVRMHVRMKVSFKQTNCCECSCSVYNGKERAAVLHADAGGLLVPVTTCDGVTYGNRLFEAKKEAG
jgi:hypothetical protein